MGSFKKYNTVRDFADATIVHKINYPGIENTGDSLTIRSRYSSVYREADAAATRKIATLRIASNGVKVPDEELKLIEDELFAALVADWTFDEPVTVENVTEFFDANPQIRDEINRKAAQDTLFLKSSDSK